MGGITTFDNVKITGDPRHDKSITLSGRINRNNYCRNCIEQVYVWISYQGHDYKTAIEPTLVSHGSRSRSGYNFSVTIPTHPDPKARKIFAKQGVQLQFNVTKAKAAIKGEFMAAKGDKANYGRTIATWEFTEEPCAGSWGSHSKCVNTTFVSGGHGTSFQIYSHTNDNDHEVCEIADGEIRM